MKKMLLLLALGLLTPLWTHAETEIQDHEQPMMVISERGATFHIFGVCKFMITKQNGQIVDVWFDYVGGVFARYTEGGASGWANEIITNTQSSVSESESFRAWWICDYNLGRYRGDLMHRGSLGGQCDLHDFFPGVIK